MRVQGGVAINPGIDAEAAGMAYGYAIRERAATDGSRAAIDFASTFRNARTELGNGTGTVNVQLLARMVRTLIHELIHVSAATGRGDEDMNAKMKSAGRALNLPAGSRGDPTILASMSWTEALGTACGNIEALITGE